MGNTQHTNYTIYWPLLEGKHVTKQLCGFNNVETTQTQNQNVSDKCLDHRLALLFVICEVFD